MILIRCSFLILLLLNQQVVSASWNFWNNRGSSGSDRIVSEDACHGDDNDKREGCQGTTATSAAGSQNQNSTAAAYNVYTAFDSASWAITSNKLSSVLGTDKQVLYDKYIHDCNRAWYPGDPEKGFSDRICEINDDNRMKMNRLQPSSVYNYTKEGYKKIRVPPELWSIIKDFWDKNRDKSEVEWSQRTVYHNTWDSHPTIVHLGQEHTGGSRKMQETIWEMTKPILEEWTGQRLSPVSLWGIRSYHNGSILVPHVDRMPLITSAISKLIFRPFWLLYIIIDESVE
jgi:prolyl 4-hydroxylase